jgi:hypothetical protein
MYFFFDVHFRSDSLHKLSTTVSETHSMGAGVPRKLIYLQNCKLALCGSGGF